MDSLQQALNGLDTAALAETERAALISSLRSTLNRLQSPWQKMQELVWENSAQAAALKLSHDLSLFSAWEENQVEVMDVKQLANLVKPCDIELLDRILRALAYKGILDSPSPNKYSRNSFSKSLGDSTMSACLDYWFDFQIPALSSLPAFAQSTSYKFPSDPTNTAWNYSQKDQTPFFEWLRQRPQKMNIFAQTMQRYSASQPSWVDLFPVEKLMSHGNSPSPIVVDIGGSRGHDLLKFIERCKPGFGSCYLQDKADVLAGAILPPEVVKKPIDFLREEPIPDARVYYLHSVLHDFSDAQCQIILSNIKAAMGPESHILVHELIRQEDGSNDLASLGEFTVMAILGSPERSEAQWRNLVTSAGLRVETIHTSPMSMHSILDVVACEPPRTNKRPPIGPSP